MANSENDSEATQVYLLGKTYLANDQGQFYIRNDPIVNMAAGDRHSIIVTQSGRAFAFGDNTSGQLGLGHTNNVSKVSCIKSLKFGDTGEKVILAACGRESSLVATNFGSIYGFGSNSHSQLGIETPENGEFVSEPVRIKYFTEKVTWQQLAMGAEHSCALSDEGVVYVWGSNEDGQCGQPEKTKTVQVPRELRLNSPVLFIACGYYHTALISDDHSLYVCGNNDDRQLGYAVTEKYGGPVKVPIPVKVKTVACGNQHTVLLTQDGQVFTCGLGDRGQLGHGSRITSVEKFKFVLGLPKNISSIAAGEGHTAIVTVRGDLYAFGDGKHGKLGSKTFSNEYELCFVDKFKSYTVLKAACGGCQTIVLARKKTDEQRQSSDSDEKIGNTTLTVTSRQKSVARSMRNKAISERTHGANASIDTSASFNKQFEPSKFIRTERDDEADDDARSDNELSESIKSATFNKTHTITNGKFRPIQSQALGRTLRPKDDGDELLRTGALDRTVRLNKDADKSLKPSDRLPALNKPSPRDVKASPRNQRKKQDSDEDKSSDGSERSAPKRQNALSVPSRNDRKPSPTQQRKDGSESDDDKPKRTIPGKKPTFQDTNRKPSPTQQRKDGSESDDDKPKRTIPGKKPTFQDTNRKPSPTQQRKDGSESDDDKPKRTIPGKKPTFQDTNRKPSPTQQRKDGSESDDDKPKRTIPGKKPTFQGANRKPRPSDESDQDEEEEDKNGSGSDKDDNDDDDSRRLSSRQPKKTPPPTVARRGSLPHQSRSGAPLSSARDGNQTIGSRPVDGTRNSFRSPATKTLAKTNTTTPSTPKAANNEPPKKETPPEQPGFFARLFGAKSNPPPPEPTSKPAKAPEQPAPSSRACSIM